MVLDKNTLLSDAQAVTASASSSDVLDLGALGITSYNPTQLRHNIGMKEIPFLVQVVEDFAALTSLQVIVQTDDNSGFASPKNVASASATLAELKAGFIFPVDKLPRGIKERYLRLRYEVTGANATSGKITAGIVLAVDGR
jgi:hypothetical protein